MPSKDPINTAANLWRSDQGKQPATTSRVPGATVSPTGRRVLSGPLLRLAKRLGKAPEELAETIPEDTLRRLKYPVIETVEPDGTHRYTHDVQVSEGVLSLPQTHKPQQ